MTAEIVQEPGLELPSGSGAGSGASQRRRSAYTITRAAVAAGKDLAVLHELAAEVRAPCLTGEVLDPAAWTSDDSADLSAAYKVCKTCPLRDLCTDFARTHHMSAGVWGGYRPDPDYKRKPRTKEKNR